MRIPVISWGNGLVVRIPRSVAEEAGIRDGSLVDVRFEDGRLIATPVADAVTLDELLAGVSPEKLHGEQLGGRLRGGEEW